MGGESPLDPAALERLEGWGGPDLKSKMIDLFLEHAPERMEGIRTGLRDPSPPMLEEEPSLAERSAHSLKSSAANLGAEAVRFLAGRIESALEKGDRKGAAALLPELEARFAVAVAALQELREKESG